MGTQGHFLQYIHECSAFYIIDIASLIHEYVCAMDIYKVTTYKDENINLLWS